MSRGIAATVPTLADEKEVQGRGGQDSPSPPASISKESASSVTEFKPSLRLYLAFGTLCVLTLMVALDGTSISVALPIIARKLHGTAIEAFWAGTSFLLTSTVFQPSFCELSHIFGRKPLVLLALLFFTVGTIVGGTANGFGALLVGRSLQGVGGGGIIALTEVIVTDLIPLRLRGQWFGFISAMWSVGSVTGPIIGGVFSQSVSWRWIFYINLPFIGIALVMVPLFLKLSFVPSSLASKLRRVDWVGTVIFVGSTTSFLIPLTWGGVQYAWTSWRTLVPLIIGAAGLVGFVLYERFVAEEPLIRLSIFGNRTAAISYFIDVIHGLCLWCLLYYMPLYYEAVKGYSPIIAGVALFPDTFTVAPMAVFTGFMITKTGKYRWAVWSGWVLTTLGLGLNILLDVDSSVPQWIFITIVSGVGLGILFPSMQFSLQAATPPKDVGFAVAMFSFFRTFGQTIGVAIGGVIFQNQMKKKLAAYPHFASQADALAKNAAALVQIIKDTPDGQNKLDLQTAYVESVRLIYIVLCALAAVALVSSLFVKSYSLDTGMETEQGFLHKTKAGEGAAEEGKREDVLEPPLP